jgi:hypothetical protein
VEKLSFCPDCGKRFTNEMNILQHMNQPSVTCGSLIPAYDPPVIQVDYFHDVLARAPTLSPCPQSPHQPAPPADTHLDDLYDQASEDPSFYPNETDGSNLDFVGEVEYHPDVPQTFPGGKTSMDNLFSDKYGSLRRGNLFYLFASQEDWQLGSWLLCSGLSMAVIDSFLSLDLVSTHSFTYSSQLIRVDLGVDKDTGNFVSVREAAVLTNGDAASWTLLEISHTVSVGSNEAHCELILSGSNQMSSGFA